MPDDVCNAFIDVIKKYGGLNDLEAQDYLEQLVKQHRFQQECWS